jgi:putative endonuclease
MAKTFFVYILASHRRTLYVGVTSDLRRRLGEHSTGQGDSFAHRYLVHRLVHVEICQRASDAIRREKQLKGWTRARKLALIEEANPEWRDLAAGG